MKRLRLLAATLAVSAIFAGTVMADWKQNNTGWWYENTDGKYSASAWQEIDGKWYYFDSDGYMAVNQWVDGYYLGPDGAWIQNPDERSAVVSLMNQYDLSVFQFRFTEILDFVDKGDYYEVGAKLSKDIVVPKTLMEDKKVGDTIQADDGKVYTIIEVREYESFNNYIVDVDDGLYFESINSGDYAMRGTNDLFEQAVVYSGKVRIPKEASIILNQNYSHYDYKTMSASEFFGSLEENPFEGSTEVYATFNGNGEITQIKQFWQP